MSQDGTIIKLMRRTAPAIGTLVLSSGEPAFTTDTHQLYIGDGTKYGGHLIGGFQKFFRRFISSDDNIYPEHLICCDTSSNTVTLSLPDDPAIGNQIRLVDCQKTFDVNNCILERGDSSHRINGTQADLTLSTVGQYVLYYGTDGTNDTWFVFSVSGEKWFDDSVEGVYSVVYKDDSYTAVKNQLILADVSSGPVTITCPDGPTLGDKFKIEDYSNSFDSTALVITSVSETINGLSENLESATEGEVITLIYDIISDGTFSWVPKYGRDDEFSVEEVGSMVYNGASDPTGSAQVGSYYINTTSFTIFQYQLSGGTGSWVELCGGIVVSEDLDLYVSTSGNDTTGTGASGYPWATPNKAMEYLAGKTIASDATVTIHIADGDYELPSTLNLSSPSGKNIQIIGNEDTQTSLTYVTNGIDSGDHYIDVSGDHASKFPDNSLIELVGGINAGYYVVDSATYSAPNTRIKLTTNFPDYTVTTGTSVKDVPWSHKVRFYFDFNTDNGIDLDNADIGLIKGITIDKKTSGNSGGRSFNIINNSYAYLQNVYFGNKNSGAWTTGLRIDNNSYVRGSSICSAYSGGISILAESVLRSIDMNCIVGNISISGSSELTGSGQYGNITLYNSNADIGSSVFVMGRITVSGNCSVEVGYSKFYNSESSGAHTLDCDGINARINAVSSEFIGNSSDYCIDVSNGGMVSAIDAEISGYSIGAHIRENDGWINIVGGTIDECSTAIEANSGRIYAKNATINDCTTTGVNVAEGGYVDVTGISFTGTTPSTRYNILPDTEGSVEFVSSFMVKGATLSSDLTLTVDGSSGSDTEGDGSVGSPFATIQYALSYAKKYRIKSDKWLTISIKDGTYNGPINIDHSDADRIKLIGESEAGVIINCTANGIDISPGKRLYEINRMTLNHTGGSSNSRAINLEGRCVVDYIHYVIMNDFGFGLYVRQDSRIVHVDNIHINDTLNDAIALDYGSYLYGFNVEISGTGASGCKGIAVEHGSGLDLTTGVDIDTTSTDFAYGIWCIGGSYAFVGGSNSGVANCTVGAYGHTGATLILNDLDFANNGTHCDPAATTTEDASPTYGNWGGTIFAYNGCTFD